jgi:hypothetical protein
MSKEIPQPHALQIGLFSGELVDTRSDKQRKQDRERSLPQQPFMFSQRDMAQFGVNSKPQLPLTDKTRLVLIAEDPRTPEEMERDTQREAEKQTYRMFDTPAQQIGESEPDEDRIIYEASMAIGLGFPVM